MTIRWGAWLMLGALLAGCTPHPSTLPPSISLANVMLERPGLLRQDLLLDVRIGNPNNFDIPLDGLVLRFDVDGRQLAEGFSNERITIARLSEASVKVHASADTIGVVRQILSMSEKPSPEIDYRLHGYAYIAGEIGPDRVTFERKGTLSLAPDVRRQPSAPPGPLTLIPVR